MAESKVQMEDILQMVNNLKFSDNKCSIMEFISGMFVNPNIERDVLEEIPLGRMGTSEDIAHAAVYLADPRCFMTGETLSITGGAELRRIPTLKEIMG